MKWKIYLLAVLWPFLNTFGQSSDPGISMGSVKIPPNGLQIGDKIPDQLWHLPLQVVNHPEGKETITLNDYKGKLIILDFWATSCSGCIAKMPELDLFQQEFGSKIQILPVTYESRERTGSFLQRNTTLKKLRLPSIVKDSLLKQLFPHSLIPHVVWIGEDGKLLAVTEAWHVTADNIQMKLNGHPLKLPVKKDMITYDKEKPLFVNGNGGNSKNFLCRSLLTGYLNGVPRSSGFQENATGGTVRAYSVNNTIVGLYQLAYPQFDKWYRKSRIILEVKNRGQYYYNPYFQDSSPEERERRKQHKYTYELIMPAEDRQILQEYIRQDLNRYFGINGRVETKMTQCFVLVRTSKEAIVGKSVGGGKSSISLTGISRLRDENISTLVWCLENIPGTLPVINATGYNKPINMDISLAVDFPSLRRQLLLNGLDIKIASKKTELFIITDNKRSQVRHHTSKHQ